MESHTNAKTFTNLTIFLGWDFIHQRITSSTAHITIQLFECWKYSSLIRRQSLASSTPSRPPKTINKYVQSIKWMRAMHLGCWPNRITTLNLYIGKV